MKSGTKRSFYAERLEERLAMTAVVAPSAAPFASADGAAEAGAAFIGAPRTSSSDETFYVGAFRDVNQSGGGLVHRLAAAAANVLAYTNWGFSVAAPGVTPNAPLFRSDEEIYDYLVDRLSVREEDFSLASLLLNGTSGVRRAVQDALIEETRELFPGFPGQDRGGVPFWKIVEEPDAAGMGEAALLLERGYGVAAELGFYLGSAPNVRIGADAAAVWGYTFNPDVSPSLPAHYTGLILSDSGDGRTGTVTCPLVWSSSARKYRLSNYGGGEAWLESLIALRPTAPLRGVTLTGYDGPYDGKAHAVAVGGLDRPGPDRYTVSYWQNGIQTAFPPSYTAPGDRVVRVVAVKNDYEAVWSAPVRITIRQGALQELAAPEIAALAASGRNRQNVLWKEVAGAAGYEIAWSADGGASWSSRAVSSLSYRAQNLPYGAQVLYRIRALGDGVSTSTSPWSAEKSLLVNPSDIDGDGFVGPGDFALLSAAWFASDGSGNWDPRFDVDGDGFVGPGDFTYISANWFKDSQSADLRYPA